MAEHNQNGAKPIAYLEQWRLIRITEGTRHLVGIVTGHPRLRDGARIVTTAIVALADDRSWAESQNTLYRLTAAGEGPLPEEWAEKVDYLLKWGWGTARVEEDEQ